MTVPTFDQARTELRRAAQHDTVPSVSILDGLSVAAAPLGASIASSLVVVEDAADRLALRAVGDALDQVGLHLDIVVERGSTDGPIVTLGVSFPAPTSLGAAGLRFARSRELDELGRPVLVPSFASTLALRDLVVQSTSARTLSIRATTTIPEGVIPDLGGAAKATSSVALEGDLVVSEEQEATGFLWFGGDEFDLSLATIELVDTRWGLELEDPLDADGRTWTVARTSLVVGRHKVPTLVRYRPGFPTLALFVDFAALHIKPATLLTALASRFGLADGWPLPAPLDELKQLELADARLSISLDPVEVLGVGLTLEVPGDVSLVPDLLEMTGLTLELSILWPFNVEHRQTIAAGTGTASIGGTGLDLTALARPGAFEVSAELAEETSIDLAAVTRTILPDLALPGRIVADAAKIDYSGGDIEVSARLASDLVVDLGIVDLGLTNMRLALRNPDGPAPNSLDAHAEFTLGSIDFAARVAAEGSQIQIAAVTVEDSEIDLTRLVRSFGSVVGMSFPSMPEVKVVDVEAEFDSARRRAAVSARSATPLSFTLAGANASIDGWFQVETERADGHQVISAHLIGETTFAERRVEATIDLSDKAPRIELDWLAANTSEAIELDDLLEACSIGGIDTPDFDVSLDAMSLDYDARTTSLRIRAHSPEFGSVEFVARKRTSGAWLHQLWIDIPDGIDSAALEAFGPGAGDIVSSFGLTNLSFAVASAASSPTDPPDRRLPKGASLVATMQLDSGNELHAALARTTGAAVLHVRASLGAGGASLQAYLDGSVQLTDDLALGDAFVVLQTSPAAISIGGSMVAKVGAMSLNAVGAVSLSPIELNGRLAVSAVDPVTGEPANLLEPLGIRSVSLARVGMQLGVRFAPPSVTLGMVAAFGLASQPSDSNQIALGIQVIPAAPVPVVNIIAVAFSVAHLDVATVIEVFVDDAPTLPSAIGAMAISDIDFRYSPTPTVLADGTPLDSGFGLAGAIDVFGVSAQAALSIDRTSGVRGLIAMTPLHVEVAGIALISLTGADGHGGPRFAFSSQGPTYLMANAQIEFLGLLKQKVVAEVTNEGFSFLLGIDISEALKIELACQFAAGDTTSFSGSASFDLDLDLEIPIEIGSVDLGTIDLDSSLHLLMSVSVSDDQFSMVFDGDFEFEGLKIDFPRLELRVVPTDLSNIPSLIVDQILDSAELLFGQFFAGVEEMWNEATEAIAEAYDEVEREISEFANEAATTVLALAASTEEAVDAVVDLAASAIEEAEELADDVVRVFEEGAAAVGEIHAKAAEVVDEIEQEIKHGIAVAAQTVATIAAESAQVLADIDEAIRDFSQAAQREFAEIMDEAAATARRIAAAANELAEELWDAAGKAIDELERQARQFLDEAAALWDEVERLAEELGMAVVDGAVVAADLTVDVIEDAGVFIVDGAESVFDEIGSWF